MAEDSDAMAGKAAAPAAADPTSARPDTAPARPDGRRRRWAAHRTQRRLELVEAGVRAIDAHGPSANAEQIAAEAGVSRTVLYRYFRDRDDLRQAIAEHVVNAVVASVLPSLVIAPEATPRQVIRGGIEVIIGWLDEHPNLYYFLRSERSGGAALESVENTLAAKVAGLLQMLLVLFGLDVEHAEPGAHGIVGLVEASGAWWLSTRSMSRDRFTDIVCTGVWHLLEGTARDHGIEIGYDDPLPIPQLSPEES
jgi:AcrR family transcriptional regulator